ncbi:conserved exported hypothetical protein [Vibrio nigripulchritudo SFn27]|uniref:Uncharacterized protein n=1 Tax=Vibrio nigripulchritudo TaxID=28173 RepID=A0A9P1JLE2_9VIBR|nr:hypothetical protein [Vibrio nigripulchritudo]CBJ93089.1 Protein of unknown function (exported) [Vibrio nigripulchritudo]CCN38636.1 conserved exported hypothetical protein [Vibrio nigripulchritudo AM115]CCN44945.1 conserved exported hypothetical protein [Vibrio nigripulchritudo FTn2]CCN79700.1 conserved exported hypothetical protein [Vibrio nigripulchritudo SO65]CCN85905.1 conserved exported hypothetical protein [Vibrio nigripulchritudo BLFn1]
MNNLILVVVTVAVTLLAVRAFKWRSVYKRMQKQSQSREVLQRYGLDTELYLGTLGVNDKELRDAIDDFRFTGHVIVDRNGGIIGGLVPNVPVRPKPKLRLVVSNDVN